jgi:hypothetical protein
VMQMVSTIEALENGSIVGDVDSGDCVYCCLVLRVVRFMQLLMAFMCFIVHRMYVLTKNCSDHVAMKAMGLCIVLCCDVSEKLYSQKCQQTFITSIYCTTGIVLKMLDMCALLDFAIL